MFPVGHVLADSESSVVKFLSMTAEQLILSADHTDSCMFNMRMPCDVTLCWATVAGV